MEVKKGTIYLTGAGPGKPELLTVMAAEVLSKADVVMHDHVVSPEILSIAKNAKLINAGLAGYANIKHQHELAKQLVSHATKDATVCRLKSGDPFLSGNGGETLKFINEELHKTGKSGINVEIIPAISSGLGATSSIGLPLTYSGVRKSVGIISGHEDGEEHDYAALSSMGTLVLYMSLNTIEKHVTELIKAGLPPATPACIIEKGCHKDQRVFTASLSTLIDKTMAESIHEPVIFVIGENVKFRI